MAMRPRGQGVRPVFAPLRRTEATVARPDRWARLAVALHEQAEAVTRRGQREIALQRLHDAERAMGQSSSTDIVRALQRRGRALRTRLGQSLTTASSANTTERSPQGKADSRPKSAKAPAADAKRSGSAAAVPARRQGPGGRQTKQVRRARLRDSRCADCAVSESQVTLTESSGQPRCAKCLPEWAKRTCPRCRATWHWSPAEGRRRLCPRCRARRGSDDHIRSIEAPSLGRRR